MCTPKETEKGSDDLHHEHRIANFHSKNKNIDNDGHRLRWESGDLDILCATSGSRILCVVLATDTYLAVQLLGWAFIKRMCALSSTQT
jgi:hypothetical protein